MPRCQKLYAFFILFAAFLLQSNSYAQQEPLALTTKVDSHVEVIFNSLVSAFIKKLPGADSSANIQLSEMSVFDQGLIVGNFVLNSSPENQTQGQISTTLTRTGEIAEVAVDVQIITTSSFFFDTLSNTSGSSITSLQNVRESILGMINSLETQNSRPRMNFGQPSTADSGFSEEQKNLIMNAITTAIQVTPGENNSSVFSFDVAQITSAPANQEALTNLLGVAPQMQWLMVLNRLEIRSSAVQTQISMRTVSQLPSSIISTYDAYLATQQQSEAGLSSQADLIQAIAPWTVRLCSSADYQRECINKVLYECSRSTDRIASCVEQAHSLRGLAEARANGDTMGIISNGADLAIGGIVDWAVGE